MSIKLVADQITPLLIIIDVSPKADVVIICNISMKEEAEGLLSHFEIYVSLIFDSVVYEAFTVSYKASMEPYQYCPIRCCAIERDTSTITSDDSFDREFAKCGLSVDMIDIPTVIEFDSVQQITLHICPNIVGLLENENGDSGTIRLGVSDATMVTSKTAPFATISYLEPLSTPPLENQSLPTVSRNNTISKEDAADLLLTPATTPSIEEALNDRSEKSNDN